MRFEKITALSILSLIFIGLMLPTGSVVAQAEEETRVGFFEEYEVKPGDRIDVPVEIQAVQDLYAIDLKIEFDPTVLTVEDADPSTDGVQPALGTFLEAGILLFNTVDNNAGVIHLVMSQVNPSEPKSGDGIILVLYIKGLVEGESQLGITNLQLSTRKGEAIPAEPVNGTVSVSEDAEEKETTPIPVQTPTMIVETTPMPTQVPSTPTPTSTPTSTHTPTEEFTHTEESDVSMAATPTAPQETSTATVAGVEELDQQPQETETIENERSNFSLLRYWWVVALVLVLALGMGVYLRATRK